MSDGSPDPRPGSLAFRTEELSSRERYQLLTSLVVPRPIARVSTRSADGRPNVAPSSYFASLAATPLLVGVSIGHRGGLPKDTLRNTRETGAFCVHLVTEGQLREMSETGGEYPPEVDEFERAGLPVARAESVDAPYGASCPARLECRLFKEVELEGAPNMRVVGEVVRVVPGTHFVDTESLRPVARLRGDFYSLIGEMPALARPRI